MNLKREEVEDLLEKIMDYYLPRAEELGLPILKQIGSIPAFDGYGLCIQIFETVVLESYPGRCLMISTDICNIPVRLGYYKDYQWATFEIKRLPFPWESMADYLNEQFAGRSIEFL